MRRLRIAGVTLAAVSALGIAAVAASANPVYFGKAEVGKTVAPVKFSASGGVAFLEGHTSKLKIECKANSATGETTGPTSTAKSLIKFTGCEVAGLALGCENAAAKEIVTTSLKSELGAISASVPGARLRPESGIYLAEFTCGGGSVQMKVKGSVIGKISGASGNTVEEGKLATSITLSFEQTGGIQKYTKFVGESGSEQLTSVVTEFNKEKGEFETHEEPGGQFAKSTLKSTPAGQVGVTK